MPVILEKKTGLGFKVIKISTFFDSSNVINCALFFYTFQKQKIL